MYTLVLQNSSNCSVWKCIWCLPPNPPLAPGLGCAYSGRRNSGTIPPNLPAHIKHCLVAPQCSPGIHFMTDVLQHTVCSAFDPATAGSTICHRRGHQQMLTKKKGFQQGTHPPSYVLVLLHNAPPPPPPPAGDSLGLVPTAEPPFPPKPANPNWIRGSFDCLTGIE